MKKKYMNGNFLMEKAHKILTQPVCDNCLGRQFGQLLSGYNNKERGMMIRALVAMSIDKEKYQPQTDMSNFSGIKFHNLETKSHKEKKCSVCNGVFEKLDKYVKSAVKKAVKYEFKKFLIGTKLSSDLIDMEENLWERVGIDFCEPLKAELNREIGKKFEKIVKARFNPVNPDINFIVNMENGKTEVFINPIFIYGEYQKLVRGIPQTKWPSGKYKKSVEQIVAKPFMRVSAAKGHKFHGCGREDIDARCLAWRPFVLELLEPVKRDINLKKLSKKIKKSIRVRKLKYSNIRTVREIKEARIDKTYRAVVKCKNIKKCDLKKIKSLQCTVRQKTPQRVLHRRTDCTRKRAVRKISAKLIGKNTFELIIKGEAGLYIKELISGDNGRTYPNISQILGKDCICKQLDVIGIEKLKK